MKNEEAKEILSAYRPSGEDAADPAFEEALKQARRDPGLTAWFEAEREQDAALARLFQSLPVPEAGKQSLLAVARVKPQKKKHSFRFWPVAAAACLALAAAAGLLLVPHPRPAPELTLHEEGSVGMADLLGLAHAAMPLDFRGDSLPELRAWLRGRGAPAPETLPRSLASLAAIGCRVFSDDAGNAISLLCLKKNGEVVHVFVTDGAARQALAIKKKTWVAQNGWSAYSWSDDVRAYVIMSRAPRAELQELMI